MTNLHAVYKKEAYTQALAFRRRGFTYTEIAKICGVSRGTVSSWLAKEDFSIQVAIANKAKAAKDNKIRIALVNKARNVERTNKYREVVAGALTEYKHYKTHPLFISGLMVYVAAGDRTEDHLVRLSTSKVELQQIFLKFAVEYLGVDRKNIHFWLLLYPGHDAASCMKYWSRKTGLSVGQFGQNQVVPGKSNKQTLQFGVGNTIIGSTLLKKKLNRWIELALKEFSV